MKHAFRTFFIMMLVVFCGLYIYGRMIHTAGEPSGIPPAPAEPAFAYAVEFVQLIAPTPAPTAVPLPLPVETSAPTATPAPTPFSLVWFSDTQVYPYKYPAVFRTMANWVLETQAEHNTLAVLHSGDIIDNHKLAGHWEKAETAISLLKNKIPFYSVAGNHDVGAAEPNYKNYFKYAFHDTTQEQMLYEGGVCWAQPLHAGGTDFLILGLGWQTDTRYLDWVAAVMAQYPEHIVLVVVHSFLYNDGNLTKNGRLVEKEIIDKYPAVRLVLCGHFRGSVRRSKEYDDGRTVNVLMYNFQDDTSRGLGYLRILMFNPITRNIALTTYSPHYDRFNYQRDTEKDTFTLYDAF